MVFEPADSSQEIARLIVENARELTNSISHSFLSKSEKHGYINLIDALIATKDTLYSQMELNDDFRFEAVVAKAKSFTRIASSAVESDNTEHIASALESLEGSYSAMKSYWLYSDSSIDF